MQNCRITSFFTFFDGFMPAAYEFATQYKILLIFDTILRGVGQVMIMDNPISGLIMLGSLIIESYWLPIMGTLGLLVSTLAAYVFFSNFPEAIRHGLYSFNGFLVGCSVAFYLPHLAFTWQASVVNIFASFFSTIYTAGISYALNHWFGAPAFTLPFNAAAITFMSGLQFYGNIKNVDQSSSIIPNNQSIIINETYKEDLQIAYVILHGSFRGVSQVFFSCNTLVGGLILLGMAICSRISAAATLFGSFLGVAYGLALGIDKVALANGLWGFNPCLAVLAIAGIFFRLSLASLLLALFCGLQSCIITAMLRTILINTGPMTLPFCISAIICLLAGREQSKIGALNWRWLTFDLMKLNEVTTPENTVRWSCGTKRLKDVDAESEGSNEINPNNGRRLTFAFLMPERRRSSTTTTVNGKRNGRRLTLPFLVEGRRRSSHT